METVLLFSAEKEDSVWLRRSANLELCSWVFWFEAEDEVEIGDNAAR